MTRKTDILDFLVTELKRINGTTDTRVLPRAPYTYKSNVFKNVNKKFKFLDEINDFPYITFMTTTESRVHIGAGVRFGKINVTFRGYVKAENSLNAGDDLLEDIDFIINSISYFGECDIEEVKVLTATTDEGLFEPWGICEVTAEILYEITQEISNPIGSITSTFPILTQSIIGEHIANAPAVHIPDISGNGFDQSGTNNGVTDSSFFTYSFWVKNITGGSGKYITDNDNDRLSIKLSTNNTYQITLKASSSAVGLLWTSAVNAMPTNNTWRHYCGWYDGVNVTAKQFQEGVEDVTAPSLLISRSLDFTGNGMTVGGNENFLQSSFGGDISQFAIWDRKIDWSTSANIELVRSSTGGAIILPNNGDIDGLGAGIWIMNKGNADGHINSGLADNWSPATSGMSDAIGPLL